MTRSAWLAALGVALVVLPWIAGEFYVNLTSQILIAAIFAASLNLLVGYGGLPSLGHAAYLGVAAYLSALARPEARARATGSTAPLALAGTTLMACFFGLIALRATGLGFLMLTLALSQVLWGTALPLGVGDRRRQRAARPDAAGAVRHRPRRLDRVLLLRAHRHRGLDLADGAVRRLAVRRGAARARATSRGA